MAAKTKLTPSEFAALLDGRQYRNEITKDEEAMAKSFGLFVMFGASDDLVEIRGADHDEFGGYNGTTILFGEGKLLPEHRDCECEFCGFKQKLASSHKVTANWCKGDWSWSFATKIPHATFKIMDDDEKYCKGIVFSAGDVQ